MAVDITVDGAPLGNPLDQWTVRPRDAIHFPEADYSITIDVQGRTRALEVVAEPRFDEPGNTAVIGGALRHQVSWPYEPRPLEASRREFALEWEIVPVSPPIPAVPPPGLFACRESRTGGMLYNTAGTANQMLRVEVHEVLPVPRGTAAPRRPAFPRGTAPAWTEDAKPYTAAELAAGTDLNLIANPAVIPITPAGIARDASTCAHFRVTYYRPNTFNFAEDDPRLVWSVVSTGGGDARFFGRSTGRHVNLHGVREGEIGLEVRFNQVLVAVYRVLVLPYVKIPFRCTILYGHATRRSLRPRSTIEDVQRHILMCNRFLWQLGLKLEPFDSGTPGWLPRRIPAANVARIAGSKCFFTANVPSWWTRGIADNIPAAAVNCLPYVFNFAYIKSDHERNLGVGCYTEVGGSAFITDVGTPSTSWIRPCGVNPDGGPRTVRMRRLTWHNFFRDRRFPHAFAMYVTDTNPNDLNFAGTIAHELGHIIGLNHRVEDPALIAAHADYDDRLRHPPRQNVMHWVESSIRAQDFDIVQTKQVRLSPLVNPPAGAVVGGAPPAAAPAGGVPAGAPPAPAPGGGGPAGAPPGRGAADTEAWGDEEDEEEE